VRSIPQYPLRNPLTCSNLSLAASKLPAYAKLIDAAVKFGKDKGGYVDRRETHIALIDVIPDEGTLLLNPRMLWMLSSWNSAKKS
jgi:hypothetical protein